MPGQELPTATHDAAQDYCTIDNQTIVGYAKGADCMKITFDSELFTDEADRDGNVLRMKTNDRRATLTLRLTMSSPSNAILDAMAAIDELSNTGVRAVSVVDGSGLSRFTGAESWVKKKPDFSLGNEQSERVWEIRIAKCKARIAGAISG